METEKEVLQESTVEAPSPVTQPISYARQTRADRLKQAAIEPDFVQQKVRSIDEILGDSVLQLYPEEIDEIVRTSGVKGSLGEQAAVAVQNALTSYNSLTEYNTMSGGNTINYFTGSKIGDEWRDIGFEAMLNREELMNINEESVGGVRNWFAKLAGGATSMGQMALEGFVTAGYLPLIKMGLQAYGEGTYNDLKKYADEHDGSLKGYEPKGVDLSINTANGFVQAYIERKFGVASPRFLTGWSRGFWKEGFSGILQEFVQAEASDLAEVAKGNEEVGVLLDNALENLIDATVAFPLQGALGAISNQQERKRADALVARARAISKGRKEPIKEDFDVAKKINDAKERGLSSVLTTEFKNAFEMGSGEGQLQKRIATELKRAVENKELDLDTANETELGQRIEQIATQETMKAMEYALEKGELISELALNNIVYKDGAIWLEGLTPEVGDKAVSYARVLAERQSGLAELQTRIDANTRELQQLKADLAEAKAQKQESRAQVLQARIDKQNALAEKNRIRAEKLKAQTAKLEKQIAKQQMEAPKAETVEITKVEEVKPVEAPKREVLAQVKKKEPVAERKSLKEERVEKKKTKAEKETEQEYLLQGTISGKGDTARGGYDEQLKRIILGEKSDLSTIQHEFAHYWIQNNFKWARSGLASQDWLRRWRDVEEWLGIEPQDRLLSKSASEKFAKAYERYILEGKVAPELQWAFEGFQKAYQDIYEDLENEYFDLEEELAPEVVDWFNRNKEQSPKRLLEADEKKIEKALTLAAGGAVIEQAPENTIIMTENNEQGQPVTYMGVQQSEIPQGDNLLVYADKTTASKLQQSAKKYLSDKVEVQQLATLDTEATLKNFTDWVARDRQGAWDAMMNPDTKPVYRSYLYKAFSEQAMNDADLALELANIDMAESVRELGQAIQALNIKNESGFDMIEIMRNLEKSKGKISNEELNNSIAEMGLDDIELSEEEMNEIDSETECKL